MQSNYPKVLLVGEYFDRKPGYGITIINLFKEWDIRSIAATAEDITDPDFDICKNYYNLGSLEIKRNFPFNLGFWKQKKRSGILPIDNSIKTSINTARNESQLKKTYNHFIWSTGLSHYKDRLKISDDFLKWVKEFSPDFIYCQLSSLKLILFVTDLHKKNANSHCASYDGRLANNY